MTIFDQTETQFDHSKGKLVKYDNTVLVIGGDSIWTVPMAEKINPTQLSWAEHPMSPVNDLIVLYGFTALSLKQSLFIFGLLRLLK